MEDLNRPLVARDGRREREFELGLWDGPYPDNRLQDMIALKEVMNTARTDELEIEGFRWLAEDLLQDQQALAQQGIRCWTVYLRHRDSDEIASFTEVFLDLRHPELLVQGHTAVMPRFQSRGLAQWIKAEMLQKILHEQPECGKFGPTTPTLAELGKAPTPSLMWRCCGTISAWVFVHASHGLPGRWTWRGFWNTLAGTGERPEPSMIIGA